MEHPEYILVRGVVYKYVRQLRGNGVDEYYLRVSVIPDGAKARNRLPARNLPRHDAITADRAAEIRIAAAAIARSAATKET